MIYKIRNSWYNKDGVTGKISRYKTEAEAIATSMGTTPKPELKSEPIVEETFELDEDLFDEE